MAVGTNPEGALKRCAECGKQKELKDRTICAACRKRVQRAKRSGVIVELKVKDGHAKVVSETPYSRDSEVVSPVGSRGNEQDPAVARNEPSRASSAPESRVGASVSGSGSAETEVSKGRPRLTEQQPTTKNPDQWYIDYYENNTGQKVVLEDTYDRKCYVCKQPFKTRLELQKFCSLECRQFFLTGGKV